VNRYDVFWRGSDGHLYTRFKGTISPATWQPSTPLAIFDSTKPYTLKEGPSAISAAFAWLDVYGRNSDNTVLHFFWRGSSWAYENMGGSANGPTGSVAPRPGVQMVGVIWTDGTFRYRYWQDSTGWTDWTSLGGAFAKDAPVMVASGRDTIHVFVKTSAGATQYRRYSNGTWTSSWQNLGGVASGSLSAASRNVNSVDVIQRGTDNKLYRNTWNGSSFGGWKEDGGGTTELISAPTIMSSGPQHLAIAYYYNSSGSIFYRLRRFDGTTWSVDSPSAVSGISSSVPPVVTSWADGEIGVFHTLTDGTVRIREKR